MAAVFCLLVALPYAAGHLRASSFWTFTGVVRLAEDNNAYQAWAKQSQKGFNRFLVAYNPAPQPRLVVHPWFWAVGRASRWTGLPLPAAMNLFHVLGAALFAAALWGWLGTLPLSAGERLTAYGLALFAGGAGPWLELLSSAGSSGARLAAAVTGPEGARTADLGFFDYVLFSNVLHSPLAGVSVALLFGALALLGAPDGARPARAGAAGLAAGLLLLIHPYDGLMAWALGAFWFIERRAARAAAAFYGAALPAALYLLWTVPGQPQFRDFTRHLSLVSLSPASLFWASALLLPAAAWGARGSLREGRRGMLLPMVWVALAATLSQSPLDFRCKLVHGAFAALAALAAPGLSAARAALDRPGRRAALVLFTACAGIAAVAGNARLWREDMENACARILPYHIPAMLAETLGALDGAAGPDDVALSSRRLGLFVPAWAGCRTYVGHWSQSPDALRREREGEVFFAPETPDAARRDFLSARGITYLLLSPPHLGPQAERWDREPFLEKVHANEGYRLYRVRSAQP
jgi:hypothetical protein